jgi:hypothetical protein
MGRHVAAVHDQEWYIVQEEVKVGEPEKEYAEFTLLKYMKRKGPNQFKWGSDKDTLKMINSDTLRKVDTPPPPHSSVVQAVGPRQQWSFIFFYSLKFSVLPSQSI